MTVNEEFNSALDKARLIYDNIKVNEYYQCALLWNSYKDEDGLHPATVLYIDENGRIKTEKCGYNIGSEIYKAYKGIELTIENNKPTYYYNKILVVKRRGIIIPTELSDVNTNYGITLASRDVWIDTAEEKKLFVKSRIFYDKFGKEILRNIGSWRGRSVVRSNVYLCTCSDEAYDISNDANSAKLRKDKIARVQVYLTKDEKLYKSIVIHSREDEEVGIYKDKITLFRKASEEEATLHSWMIGGPGIIIKSWNNKELLSQSVEIQ